MTANGKTYIPPANKAGLVNRSFTNGKILTYYDTIALLGQDQKAEPLSPKTIMKHIKVTLVLSYYFILMHTYKFHLFSKTPTRGEPPMRVKSAFGGCAIYKLEPLLKSGAHYYIAPDFSICEHVALHLDMINHGLDRIYINPSFIILHVSNAVI
jgi:hypothetical protein